jgi:hypothetical protein
MYCCSYDTLMKCRRAFGCRYAGGCVASATDSAASSQNADAVCISIGSRIT